MTNGATQPPQLSQIRAAAEVLHREYGNDYCFYDRKWWFRDWQLHVWRRDGADARLMRRLPELSMYLDAVQHAWVLPRLAQPYTGRRILTEAQILFTQPGLSFQ